jgi:hypothetical protein
MRQKTVKQTKVESYKLVTNYFCPLCSPYEQGACGNAVCEWE